MVPRCGMKWFRCFCSIVLSVVTGSWRVYLSGCGGLGIPTGATTMLGFSFFQRPFPIPRTRIKSLVFRKGLFWRNAMMRSAVEGPTPGSDISVSRLARFRSTFSASGSFDFGESRAGVMRLDGGVVCAQVGHGGQMGAGQIGSGQVSSCVSGVSSRRCSWVPGSHEAIQAVVRSAARIHPSPEERSRSASVLRMVCRWSLGALKALFGEEARPVLVPSGAVVGGGRGLLRKKGKNEVRERFSGFARGGFLPRVQRKRLD